MNSAGSLHPLLREEEIVVVENAIRLAIESIINVLYGVHSARANEYQRMMGERDKEIQRLEGRLRELEAPRRPAACASGRLQNADCSRLLGEPDSAEPQAGQQSRYEASSSEPEPDWERSAPGTSTAFRLHIPPTLQYCASISRYTSVGKLKNKTKREELRCAFSDRCVYVTLFLHSCTF